MLELQMPAKPKRVPALRVPKKAATKEELAWTPLKEGLGGDHATLAGKVGLFRFKLAGQVVYIGCATELNGRGLRKRLRDIFCRGDTHRNHHAGRMAYKHREDIEIEVMVIGSDYRAGAKAWELRKQMLKTMRPRWNAA